MATKYVCDRCGSEEKVKRVKIIAFGNSIDECDNTMLDKDLCVICRRALATITVKFIKKDDKECDTFQVENNALKDDVFQLEQALQDAIENKAGWDLQAKAIIEPYNRQNDRNVQRELMNENDTLKAEASRIIRDLLTDAHHVSESNFKRATIFIHKIDG